MHNIAPVGLLLTQTHITYVCLGYVWWYLFKQTPFFSSFVFAFNSFLLHLCALRVTTLTIDTYSTCLTHDQHGLFSFFFVISIVFHCRLSESDSSLGQSFFLAIAVFIVSFFRFSKNFCLVSSQFITWYSIWYSLFPFKVGQTSARTKQHINRKIAQQQRQQHR